LLDYRLKRAEIESSDNIFGVVVLAYLESLETKGNLDKRFLSKLSLIKKLYEKGYKKKDTINLYRFIDWVINLSPDLEKDLIEEVKRYEEVINMKYITTAERLGREEGLKEGLKQGLLEGIKLALQIKFGSEGLKFYKKIKNGKDITELRALKDAIKKAKTLDELKKL